MAITFPRTLPAGIGFVKCVFRLVPQVAGLQTKTYNSRNRYGPSMWMVDYETRPVTKAERATYEAWWDSLAGGIQLFYGHDASQPIPINYTAAQFAGLTRAGGGSFASGTTTITAVTATTVTLATLPASFVFKAGDKVQLTTGTFRTLHRIVEDVTANGSGVATVTVVPPIPTSFITTSGAGLVYYPTAKFQILPDSWNSEPTPFNDQPIAFSAQQVMI